jgi:hypothetical protein
LHSVQVLFRIGAAVDERARLAECWRPAGGSPILH